MTSVFAVTSDGPLHLVASCDKQGVVRTNSIADSGSHIVSSIQTDFRYALSDSCSLISIRIKTDRCSFLLDRQTLKKVIGNFMLFRCKL